MFTAARSLRSAVARSGNYAVRLTFFLYNPLQ